MLGTVKAEVDVDTKLFRVKTAVEGKAELLPSMDIVGHSNHLIAVPWFNQWQCIMAYCDPLVMVNEEEEEVW